MSSTLAVPGAAAPDSVPNGRGLQRPRIFTVPPYSNSAGQEAVELASMAGLVLDPWQEFSLEVGLAEQADGRWAAFEVCVNVPRQNGKGGVIEARELAGLYLLHEPLIIHSAHEFKTAKVAFRRIESLIKNTDYLRRRVRRVRYTTGEESIELLSGAELRFLARSGSSGRGFTGKTNVMDESMILGDEAMGALMPTMSAVDDPQLWYFGSAGIGAPSVQLARLRRRALQAMRTGVPDPSLVYLEWSIDPHVAECGQDCSEHDDVADPRSLARANPALGYRITQQHANKEMLSMGAAIYARERLGVGDYPADVEDTWQVISEEAWRALTDGASAPGEPLAFSIDTTPERSHTAICAAGASTAGNAVHVEVIEHRPGTDWVLDRAAELDERWQPCAWVIDEGGPAGSLVAALKKRLAERRRDEVVISPKVRQIAQACGQFFDGVQQQTIVHLDQAPMAAALAGAQTRPLGEAWAFTRKGVSVDISPLMASTFALWGLATLGDVEPEGAPNLW